MEDLLDIVNETTNLQQTNPLVINRTKLVSFLKHVPIFKHFKMSKEVYDNLSSDTKLQLIHEYYKCMCNEQIGDQSASYSASLKSRSIFKDNQLTQKD